MGSGQVFNNLTFRHMGALRKHIQSHVDYVLHHCFGHLQCQANFDNDRKD